MPYLFILAAAPNCPDLEQFAHAALEVIGAANINERESGHYASGTYYKSEGSDFKITVADTDGEYDEPHLITVDGPDIVADRVVEALTTTEDPRLASMTLKRVSNYGRIDEVIEPIVTPSDGSRL